MRPESDTFTSATTSASGSKFSPTRYNITPGRWYYAKDLPNPLKHKDMEGVKFDLIIKRYDAITDAFEFYRLTDVPIRVNTHTNEKRIDLEYWTWGHDIDHKRNLVVAFMYAADWRQTFYRDTTELVQ
jgi:hypothetical protein